MFVHMIGGDNNVTCRYKLSIYHVTKNRADLQTCNYSAALLNQKQFSSPLLFMQCISFMIIHKHHTHFFVLTSTFSWRLTISGRMVLPMLVTLNGPYILVSFSVGQYRSHLVAHLSFSLVTMTIHCGASCQINRQKSTIVFFKGPKEDKSTHIINRITLP